MATIKEKAKRYDEALDKIKRLFGTGDTCTKEEIEFIFPELAESEDERIRKALMQNLKERFGTKGNMGESLDMPDVLAWLEKQGEHAKFRDSIQVGDKVTRNQDGVLVNLSQLNRVAKKDEKQGEQKSTELVEQNTWSEEDEYLLDETIKHLESLIRITKKQGSAYSDEIQYYQRDIKWLKSLRPQNTWKPSDEQMEYLAKAITTLGDEGDCKTALILNDLRFELKKLKEE